MRFSARSLSPSPVRRSRKKSTVPIRSGSFGLNSDSDSDVEYLGSDYDSELGSGPEDSSSSSSSTASVDGNESEPSSPVASSSRLALSCPSPSPATVEQRYREDTISAIRLRTQHQDPYEEWERKTRRDAVRTARREHKLSQSQSSTRDAAASSQFSAGRLKALHDAQLEEVRQQLNRFRLATEAQQNKWKEAWKKREDKVMEMVDNGIKLDEDKQKAQEAEERKKREEEERKRQEEETKRKAQEEKKRKEEEETRKQLEEEKRKKEEAAKKEEEERIRQETEAKEKADRLKAEEEQRKKIGMTTPQQDWKEARINVLRCKAESVKPVKADNNLRQHWSKARRQITPKIGQLTNDPAEIMRISNQIIQILVINPPYPPPVYTSLLYSLSKAIILQAETEVTASKASAIPLSAVTFNLLASPHLPGFAEVFFAQMMKRVGPWPIPCDLPPKDWDDRAWGGQEKLMMFGYRKVSGGGLETEADHAERIAGILRVYFGILKIAPTAKPLEAMFQFPRYWTWFARLLGERGLLERPAAALLIYTALDVLGTDAKNAWGNQFVKLLGMIHQGVSTGYAPNKFIGGTTPEGKAARVRVELEVERIIRGG